MKRTLEILLIGLLAGGLLTGCPKKDDEKAKTDEPATAKQDEEPETAAQEEEEEEEEEEEAAEVDQENYLKAAYEVTCVRAKVEDTEKQKEILAEVYPRYGFTQESFDEAQAAMKDNETIKVSLESKMEDCTEELAMGFAKAGAEAEGDEEGEETAEKKDDKKDKKPARKWKAGTYKDTAVKGGTNFKSVQLMVNITDEGKVLGKVQGQREGKGFRIGLNGEISKDGTLQASGNQGKNNARVKGRYNDGKLIGSIQGSINEKGFRLNYTAQ